MNPIHFFTLGYFQEYLIIGIIFGIIIGTYAFFRIRYALNDSKFSKNKRLIISAAIAILAFLFCLNVWSNAAVLTLYLFLASVAADIIRLIWKYVLKDKYLKGLPKIHKKGILAFAIFAIIMIHGIYGMNHIDLTEYNFTTDKFDNHYSIVFVSDVHYNTVQNPDLVRESISKINDLKPDMVILGGDICDDRTPKESMKEVFKEFGTINSTYGTYYIYGNHDRQPYKTDYENGHRTYTDAELDHAIKSSGIKILEDQKVTINDDIVLVGRADAGWYDNAPRKDLNQIITKGELSKYILVADHQPTGANVNCMQGADLMVSGHTHGGQVFPYEQFQQLLGVATYGEYELEDMKIVVSPGLTGWGWPYRNQEKCEYVLINLN